MLHKLANVIDRGVGWMLAQSAADGSYRDAMPALGAYYKTPYFWAATGHGGHFGRAAAYMESTFFGPDGFHSETDPKAPVYNSHFFNYMMGWVARGLWIGGRLDFARKAYEYLAAPQDEFITATCDQGPEVTVANRNIGAAANAGVSFIYAGDMASARHCGDFVWSVFAAQAGAADEFIVRTDAAGALLREFPEAERAVTVIDMHKPDQMYWYLGIAMAMFGKMYEATGEAEHLDRAAAAFDVFDRCQANVADDDLTVGKVGYGAALLHRLTGEQRYLDACRRCAANLIRTQQDDGYWLYERRGDITELNRSTMLDFCAELTIWCVEMTKELSGVL